MKPEELRIGNYILGPKGPCKVREISSYGRLFVEDDVYERELYDYTPIPLTEDVLLKSGFQEVGFYENVYHRRDYRIFLDKKAKDGLVKYETENYHIEVEVKSLHQLQNLCFALTSEELNIDF